MNVTATQPIGCGSKAARVETPYAPTTCLPPALHHLAPDGTCGGTASRPVVDRSRAPDPWRVPQAGQNTRTVGLAPRI